MDPLLHDFFAVIGATFTIEALFIGLGYIAFQIGHAVTRRRATARNTAHQDTP